MEWYNVQQEAKFYEKRDDRHVRCGLCAHACVIRPGAKGRCRVRTNRDGVLISDSYGQLVARSVDPIEKKPLYHVLPGTNSYSIATAGCNLTCDFCQNADISQNPMPGVYASPAQVAAQAAKAGCASIAYTYTEPTIFMEYALDVARAGKEAGLCNIFVTNGYQTPEAVKAMTGLIDAANVDLKSFRDDFYKAHCGARLAPVCEAIKAMHAAGIFLEITTLVIPGENDSVEELSALAGFIASLDKNIPWHLSRFHPCYQFQDAPVTPMASLTRALQAAQEAGLQYVYLGNVPGSGFEDTRCPACGGTVIQRTGYRIKVTGLDQSSCRHCGHALPILAGNA